MKDLARLATAGLSRIGPLPAPATPGEALVSADDQARALLLRAGAHALERGAGHLAETKVSRPHPCPPETSAVCPPAGQAVLNQLFETTPEGLFEEALALLAERGAVLPAHLLPAALACTRIEARAAVRDVLGLRGRWLAEHLPGDAHRWALSGVAAEGGGNPESAADAAAALADLRRTFDEGALDDRIAALQRARALDPAGARGWLGEVIAAEKPDVRVRLFEALAPTLSGDDVPFLEASLKDRAATVRAAVIALLVRRPESAVSQRDLERLEACVRLDDDGGLSVTLTDASLADKAWAADALPTAAPEAKGLKQFATLVLVGRVPIAFWAERFQLSVEGFVGAAARSDFGDALLAGFARAVCRHGVPAGTDLLPLARALVTLAGGRSTGGAEARTVLPDLLARLPAAEMAELAAEAVGREVMPAVLDALPTIWPERVALRWLSYARGPERQALSPWDPFWQSARGVALRLPRGCLDHPNALLPDPTNIALNAVTASFNELITLRRRIRLEIGGY